MYIIIKTSKLCKYEDETTHRFLILHYHNKGAGESMKVAIAIVGNRVQGQYNRDNRVQRSREVAMVVESRNSWSET